MSPIALSAYKTRMNNISESPSRSSLSARRYPAPVGSQRTAGAEVRFSAHQSDGTRRLFHEQDFSSGTLDAALNYMAAGPENQRTTQEDGVEGQEPPSASARTQQQQQQQPRSFPVRPPTFPHAVSTPSTSSGLQDMSVRPHALSYPGPSPYASGPSGFDPRSAYGPYPMPRMQYGYPGPPIDQGTPRVAFSPADMMSGLHPHMYPAFSSASPPMHYTNPAATSMAIYTASPPLSPHSSSSGGPPRSSSFNSQYSYASGPPPPPGQYAQSPTMYQSFRGPSPYAQAYSGPNEEGQNGTWWFLPNSPVPFEQAAFQGPHYGQPGGGDQQQQRPPSSLQFQAHHSSPHGPPQAGLHSASSSRRAHTPSGPSSQLASSQTSPRDDALSPASGTHSSLKRATTLSADAHLLSEAKISSSHVRQAYHPNPPAQRSEWVMWAGNVPADATHNELWQFFNQPLQHDQASSASPVFAGVSSIFLISRSNCAFVNFESEAHLEAAIARFNGQPLRPQDPRCPRLVCRMRRRTDDLKAGVGGQRGIGMHARWVKEQRARARHETPRGSPAVSPEEIASRMSGLSVLPGDEERTHANSTSSFGSSNSSFLARYFPQRYFILKSLTQYDLDLSVQKGVWATQRHNEDILNQAFRTSKEVYLIFSVNKSGKFYGYARMTGAIQKDGEADRIQWASHASTGSQRSGDAAQLAHILSPGDGRYADQSPAPLSSVQEDQVSKAGKELLFASTQATAGDWDLTTFSAPPEIGRPHHRLSHSPMHAGFSLNVPAIPPAVPVPDTKFELDTTAPLRAVRPTQKSDPLPDSSATPVTKETSLPTRPDPVPLQSGDNTPDGRAPEAAVPDEDGELWGKSFKIEWVHTDSLPFNRTRHLRNPWNHGREVKVSRDGTELEPSVGRALIEEWDRAPPASPVAGTARPSQRRGGSTRQPAPAPNTASQS